MVPKFTELRYTSCMGSGRETRAAGRRLEQIPERLLAVLWKERAARRQSFRSRDGRTFRVIYPGRASSTAGPDFRDAVLVEEGLGVVRGDVEIHSTPREWESHGHADDPRYNGVVLHVVARTDGRDTRLRSGQRAPVVSLDALLEPSGARGVGGGFWALMDSWGYPKPRTSQELGDLLDRAGDERFLGRSRRYCQALAAEEPDQLLYAALMEALGYSQNRDAFLDLAGRVPYAALGAACSGLEGPERTAAMESRLMRASGLEDGPRAGPPPVAWSLFRVRPQNHPRRRIAGFARALEPFMPCPRPAGWRGRGLAQGCALLLGEKGGWRALEDALTGSPGGSAPRSGGPKPVGKGRARDMTVNCVLPFLHGWAGRRGDRALEEMSLEAYRSFPKLQENEITREMARLTHEGLRDGGPGAGRRRVVDGSRRQQGLIHLHRVMSGLGGGAP